MKIFDIYFDEAEQKCTVESEGFSFTEEIVVGVLSSVLYAFCNAIPEEEHEQFMASIGDKFAKELREQNLTHYAE